jgi:hypothetical protein
VTIRFVSLICAVIALAVYAAPAGASSLDTSSDAAALRAYKTYLRHLAAEPSQWRAKADSYIASISASCPGALAPLLQSTSAPSRGALDAFSEEIAADLTLSSNSADRANFSHLANAIGRLRWTSRHTSALIATFVSSRRALDKAARSNLCSDAKTLAAEDGQSTPAGTRTWLAAFNRRSTAAQHGANGFDGILVRFATPADGSLIESISTLTDRVNAAVTPYLNSEVPKLMSALGISS